MSAFYTTRVIEEFIYGTVLQFLSEVPALGVNEYVCRVVSVYDKKLDLFDDCGFFEFRKTTMSVL